MVFAMGLNSILGAEVSQTNQILVPVLDFMARSRHVYKLIKVGSNPCIQKGHHTRGLHDENESMVLNTCVLPVHTELYHSRNTIFLKTRLQGVSVYPFSQPGRGEGHVFGTCPHRKAATIAHRQFGLNQINLSDGVFKLSRSAPVLSAIARCVGTAQASAPSCIAIVTSEISRICHK